MIGKLLVIFILLVISVINCERENIEKNIEEKRNPSDQKMEEVRIGEKGFWKDGGCFLIKYKSIIDHYPEESITVEIPIFQGTLPPIKYEDLQKMHTNSYESLLGGICIDAKPGNVKKTALEFVDFYSKEFMGGVKEPTWVGQESYDIIIWFDFKLHGIPSSIMLILTSTEDYAVSDDSKIEDMEIDENSGGISFSIYPFQASPFYKE